MKLKILNYIIVVGMTISAKGIDIDFSSGGYNVQNEEIKGNIKYERRSSFEIDGVRLKEKEEKEKEENENAKKVLLEKQPWRKICFDNNSITDSDYINKSSNSVVIAVLNYEKVKKDGVKEPKIFNDKYKLNLLLLPGDKYHKMNDDGNGVRMASYEWANGKREELISKHELNSLLASDEDKDGLSFLEEMKGTNLVLKLDDVDKNVWVATSPICNDTDGDGLSDFEELRGVKGFVTDPFEPDTDQDGIPDGSDKNPLVKCKSADQDRMPQEWIDYLCKGDNEKSKLLMFTKGDPDEDGLTNEQEMLFKTNPLKAEKEKVIFFPKKPLLRFDGKSAYSCEVNLYLNQSEPAICQLWTSTDGFGKKGNIDNLKIKYVSSRPFRGKAAPMGKLLNQFKFKNQYMAAKIEPRIIHTFLIIFDSKNKSYLNGDYLKVSVSDLGKNPKSSDGVLPPFYNKSFLLYQNYLNTHADDINYYPNPPELTYPTNNFIYSTFEKNIFVYDQLTRKYKDELWYEYVQVLPVRNLKPNDGKPGLKDICYMPMNKRQKIDNANQFNKNTCLWYVGYMDPLAGDYMVYSDIRIMFKEDRISEDHPFVFKGNTEEEILEEIEKRYKGTVIK
jgi:hypothetical protein